MVNLSIIEKIIAGITVESIKRKLYADMKLSFVTVFRDTQKTYGFMKIMPNPRAIKDLENRAIILSQKTTDRLKGNLRFSLLEGMNNNESVDKISRRIKDVFIGDEVNTERIARNEVLISSKNGSYEAYEAAGVWGTEWATHHDARTCPICKRMDGQIRKLGNDFVDPETGEKFRTAHAHIQCRCTEKPLMEKPK